MAMNNANTELTGIFSLQDGSTSTPTIPVVLNTFSLAATSAADSNFDTYSLTFDTATNPSVVGDYIQIALEAAQTSNEKFNPDVAFDDIVLTGVTDVPEPATWALMFGSLLALAGFRIRSSFKRA
jgi:hypothetical protein